ncbi:MAG: hypothetical protein FVQ80_18525 [Planctomycetes bacterium]|nr:hypothetical protein [Planctomycetota bacterium]
MKLLIDMNLSPNWVAFLGQAGFESLHWSKVGSHRASDTEIMEWARSHGYVVFTHDLDFGAILATTAAKSPSVIQIRTQDVNPQHVGNLIVSVLRQFQEQLSRGSLISVDHERARAKVLPLSE